MGLSAPQITYIMQALKAKGMDVEGCARLGCAAGSIAVEAVGANTALRSREQIYRRAGMQMDDR